MPRPPRTIRFCPVCEMTRPFQYDPAVFHSRCRECGSQLSFKDKVNYDLAIKEKQLPSWVAPKQKEQEQTAREDAFQKGIEAWKAKWNYQAPQPKEQEQEK